MLLQMPCKEIFKTIIKIKKGDISVSSGHTSK
jgi:hypothetical protein